MSEPPADDHVEVGDPVDDPSERPDPEGALTQVEAGEPGDDPGDDPGEELAPEAAPPQVEGDPTGSSVTEPGSGPPAGARRGSALFAALLSTLIPGLGQMWAGSGRRRAVLLSVPFIALVTSLLILAIALQTRVLSVDAALVFLLQPSTLAGLLVIDGLFLAYRLLAIVDAWLVARRRWPVSGDRVAAATSIVLLVAVLGANVAVHAGVGYLDVAVADIDASVFGGDEGPDALLPPEESVLPDETPSSAPVGADPGPVLEPPSAGPIVTPVPGPAWAADGRLNVLLLGVDAGPGRSGIRTDTMILASVDVATGKAALFGIPRNLVNVPLPRESQNAFPDCHCFPMLLNALYTYAYGHSNLFPGGSNRGYRAVAGAIETLTNVHLDGVAILDLNGFIDLVDALGGLKITIPQAIYDDHYPKPDGTGDIEIYIPAGRHRLNGTTALEFARSRHSSSDYSRMRRQQAVLLALRAQIQPCNVIRDLPKFLKALKGTITTTFRTADMPDLLRLAARVDPDKVKEFAFDPPEYPEYLAKADISRIRTLVRHVFDPKSSGGSGASPTLSPTPNPFPTPIEDPCSKD